MTAMTAHPLKRWVLPTLFALFGMPLAALAQSRSVSGTVVAAGTQRVLPGVQVAVSNVAGRGTTTDGAGRFTIADLPGSTAILTFRFIGYRPHTDTVQVGATDIRVALSERALNLDALVVTGTTGGAQARELGTSVVAVNAANVVANTSIPTFESLMRGRAPGVNIITSSGQVGAGSQIRIRGIGSFSLSSTPLIYIDGIRTNNTSQGIVSRFNDISPEEIETVEVLKGPAAATLYGTEAARGVINIVTKRGTSGTAQYTFSVQQGTQWFQNPEGRMRTNYWINPRDSSLWSINLAKSEAERGTPLFQNGKITDYAGSVAGGAGPFRYYASGNLNETDGIVAYNSRNQKNFRTNLTAVPSSKFSIETSAGYISSRTYTAPEGGGAGPMWGQFASPQRTLAACPILNPVTIPRGCGWSRGAFTSPGEVFEQTRNWQDVRRFTGNVSLKYEPSRWFSHRFLVGTDYAMEDLHTLREYQTDSLIVFFLGNGFSGTRSTTNQQTTFNTYDYAGSARYNVRSALSGKSTVGIQYYTNNQVSLSASGTEFPMPGLTTISATGTKGVPSSSLTQNNTLGAYGQQEFALNERLFVTGAVRIDNNSAFGSNASFTTYPKLSVSWVASEEPRVADLLPSFIGDFRIRGAFGASGQQPGTNSALRTITPVAAAAGITALTYNTVGNPDLKPERVLGTEVGFEAGLFSDRAVIDFTMFRDVSHDAILSRSVAPSTGFGASRQFVNAGQINKQGFELHVKGQILNAARYGWESVFNLSHTTSKIIKLGGPADTLINATGGNSPIGTTATVYHRPGYSPFDLFNYRIISGTYNPATRLAENLVCDDGRGGTMPCFTPGTTTIQAPLVYYGHSIAPTFGSWTNSIRYGAVRLHVLTDFQRGAKKTDTNFGQACQVIRICLENLYPERYDPAVVATVQNSGQFQGHFIRPIDYVKLREVSLAFDVPQGLLRRVGARTAALTITGRNLGTRTRYTGVDPEGSVTGAGGANQNIGTDQAEYPPLTSFIVGLRLGY
jgi:TonB-linked SusC/RagA family outer membrane protein